MVIYSSLCARGSTRFHVGQRERERETEGVEGLGGCLDLL